VVVLESSQVLVSSTLACFRTSGEATDSQPCTIWCLGGALGPKRGCYNARVQKCRGKAGRSALCLFSADDRAPNEPENQANADE
jgi:hypothetical protein